jgi:hypothetical protein
MGAKWHQRRSGMNVRTYQYVYSEPSVIAPGLSLTTLLKSDDPIEEVIDGRREQPGSTLAASPGTAEESNDSEVDVADVDDTMYASSASWYAAFSRRKACLWTSAFFSYLTF